MGRQNRKKLYRLSLIDDASHEKIYSIKFTKGGFFTVLAVSVCSLLGGLYALLVFTPLHYTVPGYPDADFRNQAVRNAIKIDSLEAAMTRWKLYADNLNRTLAGEQTLSLDSLLRSEGNAYLEEKDAEYLRKQDAALREKVAKEEQFGVSGGSKRNLPIEGVHFFTPLKGHISNGFNLATHPAVDITAPANSVVKAALDGTVTYAGWSDEYGYTITIQHAGDILTTYKHNRKLSKKVGDKVSAGTAIAIVGNTGSLSNGDHLHFELWYKGEAVDPTMYISF